MTPPGIRPAVAIALLNWNGWRQTTECLASLERLNYGNVELFLCDNASTDGSVERIGEWCRFHDWDCRIVDEIVQPVEIEWAGADQRKRLVIVRSQENRGFAGGTNVAIRCALASVRRYRYVWTLNTDTTVEPDALAAVVDVLESHPDAGSAQSVLVWAPQPDLLDSAGMKLLWRGGAVDMLRHRPRVDFARIVGDSQAVPIFGCCAAGALYRVDLLRTIGLFDEMLFAGYEDVDLACRLQRDGYKAMLATKSIVYHVGGMSRDMRKRGWMWWIGHRNKLWIVALWYPRSLGLLVMIVGLFRAMVHALLMPAVSMRDWLVLGAAARRRWWGGAPERVRWRILRRGTMMIGA